MLTVKHPVKQVSINSYAELVPVLLVAAIKEAAPGEATSDLVGQVGVPADRFNRC